MTARLARIPPVVVVLVTCLLLLSPADRTITFDVMYQEAILAGKTPWGETIWWRDLFMLTDGDPARTQQLMATVGLPWWTDPELKIAFFRPLSALTHAFDYAALPIWLHSAHSVLWYGALCGIFILLCRSLSPGIVPLATLFFVLDPGHAQPIRWLAARNALIAATAALASLWLHHRGRSGDRSSALLAPVVLLLALLGGEMAVGTLGYLLAYAWFLDPAPRTDRIRSLLPALVVSGGWLAGYKLMGFGVANSEFYLDPLQSPLRALVAALLRLPVLFVLQAYGVPARLFEGGLSGAGLVACAIATAASLFLYLGAIRPVLSTPARRFWFWGAVLAITPAVVASPQNRNLLLASVGASIVLATVFREGPRIWSALLGLTHLGTPVLLLFLLTATTTRRASRQQVVYPKGDTLVYLTSPRADWPARQMLQQLLTGKPTAREHHAVLPTHTNVSLHRVDAQTLDVSWEGRFLPDNAAGRHGLALRSRQARMHAGQVFAIGSLTYTILTVDDRGMPAKLRLQSETALDGPGWAWISRRTDGVGPIPLPAPGETAVMGISEMPAHP